MNTVHSQEIVLTLVTICSLAHPISVGACAMQWISRDLIRWAAGLAIALVFMVGCKKTADNSSNYKTAINNYLAANPACVWPDAKKFPAQVTTSDTDKTSGYDALFDQGLLTRTTGEKKVMIIASKQVTNYDLSDKGRSAWTADTTQPGFGNFCYGHRTVQSIDSSTPNNGQPGATTQVTYHWSFTGAPDWAKAAETQNAFPQVRANLAGGGTGTATLVDTNNGWQVQAPARQPASNADGTIVQ